MDEPKNRTLIYRMVHYKNLISKRDTYTVPIYPHGVLNDYIPFYFSPRSPMLFAIKSNPKDTQVQKHRLLQKVQVFVLLL